MPCCMYHYSLLAVWLYNALHFVVIAIISAPSHKAHGGPKIEHYYHFLSYRLLTNVFPEFDGRQPSVAQIKRAKPDQ